MATRDLTRRFAELRVLQHGVEGSASESKRPGDAFSESGLLDDASTGTSWASTRHQLPPLWVDKVDGVEEDVRLIQLKLRELSALHTKRLMVTFDESEAERERDVEDATREVTALFRRAERQLKHLMGESAGLTQAEATVRNNIQRATARKLQSLSGGFRTSQKDYLRRLQAQKKGDGAFDFLAEEERASKHAKGRLDPGFNEQQMAVLEDTEVLVGQRDGEINNIVKSIEDLSTIFKELAVLVIDQGTILDRIDFNMEQVVEHTREGVSQLQRAEEHQKSALPLKCIGILVVLIIIMLGLLVWKHSD
ncbi:unnamed protein product [Ectocarpus sp. 6 AP-2014]